jgi:hypothetical protein
VALCALCVKSFLTKSIFLPNPPGRLPPGGMENGLPDERQVSETIQKQSQNPRLIEKNNPF